MKVSKLPNRVNRVTGFYKLGVLSAKACGHEIFMIERLDLDGARLVSARSAGASQAGARSVSARQAGPRLPNQTNCNLHSPFF